MKKTVSICTLLLVCTCNFLSSSIPKEIVVAYHKNFPPYSYEENDKHKGIFPEIVIEAAKVMGIKVKLIKLPWKRMLHAARIGEVDAIMPLFKTKERMELLDYPTNGIAIRDSFFFTDKDCKINYTGDLNELKDYVIGIVEDYSHGEEFDNDNYLQKDKSSSDEALVEKFAKGRFQVGLSSKKVVKFYARKFEILDKIRFLEPHTIIDILHVGFSRKKNYSKELARQFSDAIEKLGKEGKHQKILRDNGCEEDIVFFREIIIGTDEEDYPSYSYWENGQVKGVCPEIINKAAEHIGVKVRYVKMKWKNFRDLARKGEIDAVMPLFKNEEKEKYLYYPKNGMVAEKNYFFTLKNSGIRYSGDLNDLRNIPIGVVKNYSYGKNFDDNSSLKKEVFASVKFLVDKLKKGEIKVIIGNDRIINHFANESGISEKIKPLGPPFPRELLYIAFSKAKGKGHKKLAESFSDSIKKLRKEGKYQKILKSHGVEKKVVLLAADNWQPYHGENLTNYGPLSEIIIEAFKRVGYQVKIEFMPWANVLDKVKKGKYDAGFAGSYTEQRAKDYYFSNLIAKSSSIVFYKRKDRDIIYNSLENYRIGVVRGFVYDQDFDNEPGLQRIEANNSQANIYNLLKGRLDLVIIDKRHAQYLLNRMSPDESNKLEFMDLYPDKKGVRHEMRLLISKESVEAEQINIDFNHGLKQILEDGTVDRIFKKHGVKDEIFKN